MFMRTEVVITSSRVWGMSVRGRPLWATTSSVFSTAGGAQPVGPSNRTSASSPAIRLVVPIMAVSPQEVSGPPLPDETPRPPVEGVSLRGGA